MFSNIPKRKNQEQIEQIFSHFIWFVKSKHTNYENNSEREADRLACGFGSSPQLAEPSHNKLFNLFTCIMILNYR